MATSFCYSQIQGSMGAIESLGGNNFTRWNVAYHPHILILQGQVSNFSGQLLPESLKSTKKNDTVRRDGVINARHLTPTDGLPRRLPVS